MRAAKKKRNITCDIAAYQPLLDDSMLAGFDTNYKTNPPLRTKRDNDSLIKALKDGTIDVICSGHTPQDEESKSIEFDHADAGIINLQTFAANLVSLAQDVRWDVLIEKVTSGPRTVLGLDQPVIYVEAKANLTLLDPNRECRLDDKSNLSKSKNSPWFNQTHRQVGNTVFVHQLQCLVHLVVEAEKRK